MENRGKLLWAGFLTLIAAGVGFGVRTGIVNDWERLFGFTKSELGAIQGGGLLGFGAVILLGSLITDYVGYRKIMLLAFVLHLLSAALTLAAGYVFDQYGREQTYNCLWFAMILFSVGNGLCETVINPLTATLYPERKTHYLNILHAGWPGGLMLGGLFGFLFIGENAAITQLRWEIPMLVFLVPTLWYGWIVLTEKFPKSEASAAGVSYGEMLAQFASPVLLLLLLLHACVGYVELGTDSWITTITDSFTGQGFLLFIYASTVMFVLRFFAGPIVERTNPLGLLCMSALLGMSGLLFLSYIPPKAANAALLAWLAVTVYSLGKTFLWPTMLGVVGERFPKGGALAMGAMGGVGMLSAGFLGGPGIGHKQDYFASTQLEQEARETYDRYAAEKPKSFMGLAEVRGLDGAKVGALLDDAKEIDRAYELKAKQGVLEENKDLVAVHQWWHDTGATNASQDKPKIQDARIYGGQMALRYTAAVPAAMFVGYLILVLYFAARGGYRVEHISGHDDKHAIPPVEKSHGEEYTGGAQGAVR